MSKYPWLRRLTIASAICVGLIVALMAFLLFFQPTLDLSSFKHLLEAQLTGLTGAPVTLQELHVKTSLQPGVEVRDLRVAETASVETTQLQIELIPLLKRHISIESLKLDQVTVQLRPAIELARSWIGQEDRPKSPYRVDALENLEFDRVQLNVTDELGVDHRLVIDELDAGITRSSPLKLEARGSFEDLALQLEAEGPTLEDLFAPASTLPLAADLEIAGARVSAEGTLTKNPNQLDLTFDFTLQGDDLTATLAAADVEIPSLGPFHIQGNLLHSGGPLQLSALKGQIDDTDFSGELQLSFENERVALAGNLQSGRIDLQPWLDPRTVEDDPGMEETGSGERLLDRLLPVEAIEKALAAMDLDLEVAIDGLEGLPTTVEELTLSPNLQDGRLTLPYRLQVAGAPVQGQAEVASTQGRLELALDLTSSTLPLDQLTDDLGRGLTTGTIGQIHLTASSSGDTVGDLINQLAFDLETGAAQVRFLSPDGDRQVDLVLTRMELRRSVDMPIRATLNGDLRGYPYRIELEGQETKDWRSDDPWPFTLTADGLGARTRIEGRLSPEPEALSLDLELDISGDRIGDLEPWWGVPASADYPYDVHGTLVLDPARRELRLDTLRVGQTSATMTLQVPPQEQAPILVHLGASALALDEFLELLESAEKDLGSEPVLTIDIPIWTEEVTLPDSKIHVEIDRALRNSPGLADFSNVVADMEILSSHLGQTTFSARAEEASFQGKLEFDWEADPPEMILGLDGEAMDVGRLVALDEIAPDLAVRVQRFDLQVTAAEKTLRQMFLKGANISGKAEDVFLSVPILDAESPLELTLNQAEVSEVPNRPIQVRADGHLSEWPIALELTVHNKKRTGPEQNQVPVELALRTGDVHLETKGEVTMPARANDLDLSFSLTADRLSSFEPFLGHRLSAVGPVAVSGDLAIQPDRYALEDLSLQVGESDIHGTTSLDLTGARPRIAADLSSHRIHLAEFFDNPSPPDGVQGEPAEKSTERDNISAEEDGKSWLEKLQSSKLATLDLDVKLQSEEIYWGGETGGGGHIKIQSEEGRLALGPFSLALADGNIDGQVTLVADEGRVAADLELAVDNVEYGPILELLNPEAEGRGSIDLETRLVTPSVPADQIVTATGGDFRLALFPRDIDTTLLSLWGSGLIRSMVRVVDPTDESVLNCMVGTFSVAEGQMTVEEFWFDTSSIRARGKGSINLEDMTLNMTLRPRPKKRTFLTLATPAKIKGPVADPSISLTKGGLVGTAFRIYMWWLTIYTQVLKKPLPTDGTDICFLPLPPETAESPLSEATQPPGN